MTKKSANRAEETLQVVLNRLKVEKIRCLDTETSGLDARVNHIVGHVLAFSADPRDSYYVPFRHLGNANVGGRPGPTTATGWDGSLAPGEAELIDAIDQQGTLCFGHNLAFDLRFLWIAGMRKLLPRFEDTMHNACLINEWMPKFSLEYCANAAGVFSKKSSQIALHIKEKFPLDVDLTAYNGPKEAMAHFWRLAGDDPVAIEYATGDGTSTWQLREWQTAEIARPLEDETIPDNCRTLERVHDIESRLIPVLARMTGIGIKVDTEYLELMLDEDHEGSITSRINRLREQFPAEFNFRSPNDVKKWCTDNGHTDWPFSPGRIDKKSGKRIPQPSFPSEWLETHEAGKKIVAVRRLLTLRDTFFTPLRDTHLYNGRVHTNYHQLRDGEYGTPTGRLSSSDPNLQAVSKHDWEIGKLHRRLFVPDEGKRWANADYSQIEPRLLAYYADIEILLNGYHADPPVDAHTAVSASMNKNWPNMTKDERKHYRDKFGKRINQTVLTGGGPGVLVKKYGVPEGEVNDAWKAYHRAMPELKPFQKKSIRIMKRRGYVLTLLGRRCHIGPDGRDYIAPNRLLQGGNADIVKAKMVQIDDYLASVGRPVDVLNTIHDDLAFQFDEAARPVYNKCLEIAVDFGPGQPIELDIPMVVDVGEGSNWSEATYHE